MVVPVDGVFAVPVDGEGPTVTFATGADIDLEAFRKEAREWLEANFPASLKGKSALASAEVRSNEPDLVKWRKAMGEKGWGTPTWPTQYGGGGLTPAQARVLGQSFDGFVLLPISTFESLYGLAPPQDS